MNIRGAETEEDLISEIGHCNKSESYCLVCPISIANNHKGLFCWEFAAKFPTEVARRMGYDHNEKKGEQHG